ncbi:large-conductance mechanosensitive channel protein MscL [Corynebacterium ammoniagenes]|uniref:large-conductance mechanosensitive channel protein MscL n=1 Tax=Corynebacterium ammoniagenes TaxID=1697 RepID=UPI001459D657|nr:large-conductance mechanosensitive channel protein MscL [Corynebacterium ammoniagenes]NMF31244.1 large-conductance mechanosensitive channel protein MscL [Corynebacterium ammoniagenes]
MLKGFKDFIMRGNVIDLAVGVIIGGAFTAIVTALTDSLIQPIINSFGSADMAGLGFQITENENTFIDFGVVITAVINFLIIAGVVYFIIVAPINKLNEINNRRLGVQEEAPAPTSEELLAEIRDLMAADAAGPTGAHGIDRSTDRSTGGDTDRPTGDDTK